MSNPTAISCPHCGAPNVSDSAFCEACGKALPSGASSGPRVVSADALPQSAIGHRVVGDELLKTQKSASNALLAVAIIASIGAVIVYALSRSRAGAAIPPFLTAIQVGLAGLFWGLWFWSRSAPLPAAITGLVAYSTLITVNVITSVSDLAKNSDAPRRGFGGIGIGILDIVIIVVLVKGIQAGLKHKRLVQASGPL